MLQQLFFAHAQGVYERIKSQQPIDIKTQKPKQKRRVKSDTINIIYAKLVDQTKRRKYLSFVLAKILKVCFYVVSEIRRTSNRSSPPFPISTLIPGPKKEVNFACLFSKSDSSNALASNTSTKLYFPSSVTYIENVTVNPVM